jgi:carbonic anhydrase
MPSFRSNPRELADKIRAVLEMSEEQREEFRRRAMEARSPELFVGCGDGRV